MTRRIKTGRATHITDARFRNSQERVVGQDGHINAGSTVEVMQRLAEIASMIGAGEMFTDVSHVENAEVTATERREALENAYSNPEEWAEIGSGMAAELQERTTRDGFMRTILDRGDVAEGSIPRIRIRTPNVTAVVSRGPSFVYPQFVRDRYLVVDEFTISANPRVEELDMHQGSSDILEDKFYEGQEKILVSEDRVLVNLMNQAVGIYNAPIYFSGAFTPAVFTLLRQTVTDWSLAAVNMVFSNDILTDIMSNAGSASDFSTWFDPITKYEIIQTGRVGNLLGLELMTDGYREPTLKVLGRGEVFCTTQPNYLGAYTDRGPIRSEPVNSYPDGVAARGWYLSEHISAAVANAKGVAKASRL